MPLRHHEHYKVYVTNSVTVSNAVSFVFVGNVGHSVDKYKQLLFMTIGT